MNKKKRDSLYSVWSILMILSVALVLFALLFASFTKDYTPKAAKAGTKAAAQTAAPQATETAQALTTSALLGETADGGDSYVARMADTKLACSASWDALSWASNLACRAGVSVSLM